MQFSKVLLVVATLISFNHAWSDNYCEPSYDTLGTEKDVEMIFEDAEYIKDESDPSLRSGFLRINALLSLLHKYKDLIPKDSLDEKIGYLGNLKISDSQVIAMMPESKFTYYLNKYTVGVIQNLFPEDNNILDPDDLITTIRKGRDHKYTADIEIVWMHGCATNHVTFRNFSNLKVIPNETM